MLEIAASGVDMNKIVIGKPGTLQDANSGGFIDPAMLSTCLSQAMAGGWRAGVMAYQVGGVSVRLFVRLLTVSVSGSIHMRTGTGSKQ